MDLPNGYEASLEGFYKLVKEKQIVALKPDAGSHGEGFFKLEYRDNQYVLNNEPTDESRIYDILKNSKDRYLVTEFVQTHLDLQEMYSGSLNTIRLLVFKRDGETPQIGNAYMRIGTEKSGVVDNMAAGGMFARVDAETGWYGGAQVLDGGSIKPSPQHPDTGVTIEGVLPHWDFACATVLKMAEALPQIEYFGFDLAITADGIKIIEINRFPDYPKIEQFNDATIEYLLYKLRRKKRAFGYNKKPCRCLLPLPER
jgi:glutathione synthase/RimK-type ligase-like ATP-grasp enzyme